LRFPFAASFDDVAADVVDDVVDAVPSSVSVVFLRLFALGPSPAFAPAGGLFLPTARDKEELSFVLGSILDLDSENNAFVIQKTRDEKEVRRVV